jgi:ABC-2 type transport system ATP-binding protein
MSQTSPTEPQSILRFQRVTRQFGARAALLDASVDLQPGLVGLLGPNGAGKTTFLHLAAGLTEPSSGTVSWLDGRPRRHPSLDNRIAMVADGDDLPRRDTPLQFVAMLLRCAGLTAREANDRAESTLLRLGLQAKLHEPLQGLSRGQRQRVKLAHAFALPVDLLLLDEPLNALDPVWRLEVAALMREAVQAGTCVVLSSHILEEVEPLADWLVLLFRGRLVAAGTRRDIQAMLSHRATAVRIQCTEPRKLAQALLAMAPVTLVRVADGELSVQAEDLAVLQRALPAAVVQSGVRVALVRTAGDDLAGLFQVLSQEVR